MFSQWQDTHDLVYYYMYSTAHNVTPHHALPEGVARRQTTPSESGLCAYMGQLLQLITP